MTSKGPLSLKTFADPWSTSYEFSNDTYHARIWKSLFFDIIWVAVMGSPYIKVKITLRTQMMWGNYQNWKVLRVFQIRSQRGFREVSIMLWENFKGVSSVFEGSRRNVSCIFHGCFQYVSMIIHTFLKTFQMCFVILLSHLHGSHCSFPIRKRTCLKAFDQV